MGDFTDMVMEGMLCQDCGEIMLGEGEEAPGHPQSCGCADDCEEEEVVDEGRKSLAARVAIQEASLAAWEAVAEWMTASEDRHLTTRIVEGTTWYSAVDGNKVHSEQSIMRLAALLDVPFLTDAMMALIDLEIRHEERHERPGTT